MKRSDKGQVLILVALAIFVLLGFAALGIDVGFMYSVRHELQRSADAGALAGASAFTTGDWNNSSVRSIADSRAREFASKDKVVQTTLNPASEVAVSFPLLDRIEVVTSRTADLFFARIFGMSNRLITARAVAQAAVAGPPVNVNCVKPLAIPYPWNDTTGVEKIKGDLTITNNPDGLYTPGETVYKDCQGGVGLCRGNEMILKVGNPSTDVYTIPSGQQVSGHFFIMQGNPDTPDWFTGGKDYSKYLSEGCLNLDMTLSVDLLTGNKVGPTEKGITVLRNADPGSTWSDTDGLPSSLKYPIDNDLWMTSPRVVRVVIYDPSISIVDKDGIPFDGHGTKAYVPKGYSLAGFWIDKYIEKGEGKNSVVGRYIPGSAFGGSSGPPGPVTGTEVKVISLVE